MSKAPSILTQFKNLRREHKRISDALTDAQRELTYYRGRASKAEADAAEWKKRFDILLSREPTPTASEKQDG